MTKQNSIYKCEICGNIAEIIAPAGGTLFCCGKPMAIKDESTKDGVGEKHIPVIEKLQDGILVKVGEIPHPMLEEHHISFIEISVDNKLIRAELKAGDKPEAFFNVDPSKVQWVREYCNLHGLWKA